jgi:hypothetical protein
MAVSRFIDSADQYYMRQMVDEEVRRREQQIRLEYEMGMQQNVVWQMPVLGSTLSSVATTKNPDERLLVLLTEDEQ